VCPTDAIEMVERKKVTLLPEADPVGLKKLRAKGAQKDERK